MKVLPDDIDCDEDLEASIYVVSIGLQQISNYLNQNPEKQGRVRFPRGFLGTVGQHSRRYSWIKKEVLKRNLSYQCIFHDLLCWVSSRTDVYGIASEMIYKHAIVVNSSIAEGLLDAAARQLGYAEAKFPKRLSRLLAASIITRELHDELVWMWDVRHAVHVHIVNHLEWEKYKVRDATRASKAVRAFEHALELHFSIQHS